MDTLDTLITGPALKLPDLSPRYRGMPRRYEETKPVIVQGLVHRKIVGLGHEIQLRLLDKIAAEKAEAVALAEDALREKFEKREQVTLIKLREEMSKIAEEKLRELQQQHEKQLKEETVRVEMVMQQVVVEQVQQERLKGEEILTKALVEVEEQSRSEVEQAVSEARLDEKEIAAAEVKEIEKDHESELEELQKEHMLELANRLEALEAEKDLECQLAVAAVREENQQMLEELTSKMSLKFRAALDEEMVNVEEKSFQLEQMTREIVVLELEKERLQRFLTKTRYWFQDFIDRAQKLKKGEIDFVLPPAYIDEIERGLMEAQP